MDVLLCVLQDERQRTLIAVRAVLFVVSTGSPPLPRSLVAMLVHTANSRTCPSCPGSLAQTLRTRAPADSGLFSGIFLVCGLSQLYKCVCIVCTGAPLCASIAAVVRA